MIIETPLRAQDVVTLKTIGGEEVIGRFVKEDAKTITLKKPMSLMMSQQGVGLGPFVVTVNPDIEIALNKNAILFTHKTDSEMAKQYMSSTTGIAM